jgi:hypothetical protein
VKALGRVEVWNHSFLTPVLGVGEWSTSRLGRFNRGKVDRYPLGGPQSQSVRFGEEKHFLPLQRFEARKVQPVAAVPTTIIQLLQIFNGINALLTVQAYVVFITYKSL